MDAPLVVVGGGPVGATLGLLMPEAVVLDAADFPRDKPCGEGLMPAGVAILRRAGVDLRAELFPPLRGVRYRLPGGRFARSDFADGVGYGTRRTRLDALLAERGQVRTGVRVTGLEVLPDRVLVETSAGRLTAGAVVGADGMRSTVSRLMAWERPSRGTPRYAIVGHLEARAPSSDIEVTLLGDRETYLAAVGDHELLFAVLGNKRALRQEGSGVAETYHATLALSHPELAGCHRVGRLRGAGPFNRRPSSVASGRVFLVGDAAGFLDPLTGDAMTAGLQQALEVARLVQLDPVNAAAAYRGFCRRQWRRRTLMSWLARTLSSSSTLSRGAVSGMGRRPRTLQKLLAVDQGEAGLTSLNPLDWSALLGITRS